MEAVAELTPEKYLNIVLGSDGIPDEYVKDPSKYDPNFKATHDFYRDYKKMDTILKEEPFRAKNIEQLIDELNKVAQNYDENTPLNKKMIATVVSTFFADLYDEINQHKIHIGKNIQFEEKGNYQVNIAELLKKGTFKSYVDNEFNDDLENIYYTPNLFKQYEKDRTKKNVMILNCLWADVDDCDLTAEQLEIRIAQKGLPAPSFIIKSGHGYHIIWKLRPFLTLKKDTQYFRKKWKRIMKYISEDLKGDSNAISEEKYLRLPFTINNKRKANKPIMMSSIVKYEPENSYNLYEDFYVEKEEEYKKYWAEIYAKKDTKTKVKTEIQSKKKNITGVQDWTLTKNKVNALMKWLKMRNFDIEGKRNAFLRIMQMGNQNIYEINKLLKHGLEDYELEAIIKNHNKQRNLGNYYIMPKKNKIINMLGITAEEAEQLNTFKSDEYYSNAKFEKYSKTMKNSLVKVATYKYLKKYRGKTKTLIGTIGNSKQAISNLKKKATVENIKKELHRFKSNQEKLEKEQLEMKQHKMLDELVERITAIEKGLNQKKLLEIILKFK